MKIHSYSLFQFLAFAFLLMAVFQFAPDASAQTISSSAALGQPTTSSGLTIGLNETLRWVFLILKFLAIVACGWGSYKMWSGEISSGVWAYVAALFLFFAPTLVDLAQKIGQSTTS